MQAILGLFYYGQRVELTPIVFRCLSEFESDKMLVCRETTNVHVVCIGLYPSRSQKKIPVIGMLIPKLGKVFGTLEKLPGRVWSRVRHSQGLRYDVSDTTRTKENEVSGTIADTIPTAGWVRVRVSYPEGE